MLVTGDDDDDDEQLACPEVAKVTAQA